MHVYYTTVIATRCGYWFSWRWLNESRRGLKCLRAQRAQVHTRFAPWWWHAWWRSTYERPRSSLPIGSSNVAALRLLYRGSMRVCSSEYERRTDLEQISVIYILGYIPPRKVMLGGQWKFLFSTVCMDYSTTSGCFKRFVSPCGTELY